MISHSVGSERYGGYTERLVDQLYNICSASMVIVNKERYSDSLLMHVASVIVQPLTGNGPIRKSILT